MEVGSVRERVLIALLIHKFGKDNVETRIPITEPEIDVRVCGEPISIKTITSSGSSGVKVIWTVDAEKARSFRRGYAPSCDILLARIRWGDNGGLCLIPLAAQQEVFEKLGRDKYLKLPKEGTNPRGVEFSAEAMEMLLGHKRTRCIRIRWERPTLDFDPYKRWVDYWGEN